ncbi:MAG: PaaI family thioesterase [Prevotella sp.]|nr:PaaI family thioesterase [Prevotella sp.]
MKITVDFDKYPEGLSRTLGITYHSTDDPATVEARLECTPAVAQPWGVMAGGATLGLAENAAGIGAMGVSPGYVELGIQAAATHMSPVKLGETAIATARLLRKGGTLHNWRVEIHNGGGKLISEVEITNYTIKEQP